MSFGQEDVDRYIVVYKKDYAPSDDEILARRNGEEWNKETAEKYLQMVISKNQIGLKLFPLSFLFFFWHFIDCCRGLKQNKWKNWDKQSQRK